MTAPNAQDGELEGLLAAYVYEVTALGGDGSRAKAEIEKYTKSQVTKALENVEAKLVHKGWSGNKGDKGLNIVKWETSGHNKAIDQVKTAIKEQKKRYE